MESKTNRSGNLIQFLPVSKTETLLFIGDVTANIRTVIADKTELAFYAESFEAFVSGRDSMSQTKSYDVIIVYGRFFIEEKEGISRLGTLLQALKPEGKIYLALENPFSLHKLAGEAESDGSVMKAFLPSGFQNSAGVGRDFIKNLCQKAIETTRNDTTVKFFYPYPDIHFPFSIYTDDYLPGTGECDENHYNFANSRFEFFDEMKAVDEVVKAGAYPLFANGFLVEIAQKHTKVLFCRYSAERKSGLKIRTEIIEMENGERIVQKTAYDQESNAHIQNLLRWEKELREQLKSVSYRGKRILVNQILDLQNQNGILMAKFPFIEGESLEGYLDGLLLQGKFEQCKKELLEFCEIVKGFQGQETFIATEAFHKVFGEFTLEQESSEEMTSLSITDIDMICQNVLLGEDVTFIDYEWTFDFPIPLAYLQYRILFCYIEQKNRRNIECFDNNYDFYRAAGITEKMKRQFEQMETHFQKYVQGNRKLLRDRYTEIGKPAVPMEILHKHLELLTSYKVEAGYYRLGKSEQRETITIQPKIQGDGINSFVLNIPATGVSDIQIKFGIKNSMIRIGLLAENADGSRPVFYETNGVRINPILYMYNEQPEMRIRQLEEGVFRLHVSLEIRELPATFISESVESLEDKEAIIQNRDEQIQNYENSTSWKITKPLRELRRKL